jgi:hypothetical protein
MKPSVNNFVYLMIVFLTFGALRLSASTDPNPPAQPIPPKTDVCGAIPCVQFNWTCLVNGGGTQCANCYAAGHYCFGND